MPNNATMFLCDAWEKARRINKRDKWNVEAITHADEARHLVRCVDIDHARHDGWFLTNDANTMPANTCQSHNCVPGPTGLKLQERSSINNFFNDLMHDIRLRWIDGHYAVKGLIHVARIIIRLCERRILDIVRWQVGKKMTHHVERILFTFH